MRDYSTHEITFEDVTVSFSNTIIDVSTTCGSKSSINITKFICEYLCGFTFKMYAVFYVPLHTTAVL